MKTKDKIVILTGAGISAESGLGTFRDTEGLWSKVRIEDVATPKAFASNPQKVHDFYNQRREQAVRAEPNAAHQAIAQLQRDWPGDVVLITQNVDNLHEKAGSEALHMHGGLASALCAICAHRWEAPPEMAPSDLCPNCAQPATRPDVVWFGEMPYHMDIIADHLSNCALFAAIGTSGQVYPAAGFVAEAAMNGAQTIEMNLTDSKISAAFERHLIGPATRIVPEWVAGFFKA